MKIVLSKQRIKEAVKKDIFKSFVRYWAVELGEHYPNHKKLFYSLSAFLTSLIFFFGFAGALKIRNYALQYDAQLQKEIAANSTRLNGTLPIISGFSLSGIFGMRFVKSWKKRVVIGISADIFYLLLFVFWTFFSKAFFNYLYI